MIVLQNNQIFKESKEHTRQVAAKQPPLIPLTKIGIEKGEKTDKDCFTQTLFIENYCHFRAEHIPVSQ